MRTAAEPPLQAVRELLRRRYGWGGERPGGGDLDGALRKRLGATGIREVAHYVARVHGDARELLALAEELRVGESYFFRHPRHFDVLRQRLLRPAREGGRRLRLLSAGCAAGEEAYSLAIAAREEGLPTARVLGVDLSAVSLATARVATYSRWALRGVPEATLARWFEARGQRWSLRPEPRGQVGFVRGSLLDDGLWAELGGSFDAVFCRNVLMYLTPEGGADAVRRIAAHLNPGGLLFVSHAETLRYLTDDFELRTADGAFYYELRGGLGVEGQRPPRSGSVTTGSWLRPGGAGGVPPGASPPATPHWTATAAPAAQRGATPAPAARRAVTPVPAARRAVTPAPCASRSVAPPPAPRAAERRGSAPADEGPGAASRFWREGLEPVFEHIAAQRFDRALRWLEELPDVHPRDGELLVLEAVVRLNSGDRAGGEAACREALELDDGRAEAWHLLGLCHEQEGQLAAAAAAYREAASRDAEFALAALHLGRLSRKLGDLDTARRELTRAVELMQGEEPTRLLLFAGGFGRPLLVRLARSELDQLGGPKP